MADNFPKALFEQIHRRASTEKERNRLLNVKSTLGLSDNDELWPFIITLDYYTIAILNARHDIVKTTAELREQVKAAVSEIEHAATLKADKEFKRSIDRISSKLEQRLVNDAEENAPPIFKRNIFFATLIAALIGVVCLGTSGVAGYLIAISINQICSTEAFLTSENRIGCYID